MKIHYNSKFLCVTGQADTFERRRVGDDAPPEPHPGQEHRQQAPLGNKQANNAPKSTLKSTVVSFEARNKQACETSRGSLNKAIPHFFPDSGRGKEAVRAARGERKGERQAKRRRKSPQTRQIRGRRSEILSLRS